MKRVINEKTLRNLVKKCISEALRYDKDAKRYFPKYTGDPHSDAGKYAANNGGDFEFSHNDYKWSNPYNQKRFEELQSNNDFEPDFTDPDIENEGNAEDYLTNHEPNKVVEHAVEELRGEFENMIGNFITSAAEKYPIFKDRYYRDELMYNLRYILDEYDY